MWKGDHEVLTNDLWVQSRLSLSSCIVYLDKDMELASGLINKTYNRKNGYSYVVQPTTNYSYLSTWASLGLIGEGMNRDVQEVHWSRIVAVFNCNGSTFFKRGLSPGTILLASYRNHINIDVISEFSSSTSQYYVSFKLQNSIATRYRGEERAFRSYDMISIYRTPLHGWAYPVVCEGRADIGKAFLLSSAEAVRRTL